MTTPVASTPRRQVEMSPLRRLSRNVLVIGTVVAVVAAFGPVWVVRVGVLVAVAAAILSTVTAWRELTEARHQHAKEVLAVNKAHGSALKEERRQNGKVVETLAARAQAARDETIAHQDDIVELSASIVGLTSTIGTLRAEISTLHGRHELARSEIRQRESAIADLRETVQAREAELRALSEAVGQVRSIPRRVLAEPASSWTSASASAAEDDVWSADREPGVTELTTAAVVLPNYEGDRKFA